MLLLANLDDSNFDDSDSQKSDVQIGYSAQSKPEKKAKKKRAHYNVNKSEIDPDSDLSINFEDYLLSIHNSNTIA